MKMQNLSKRIKKNVTNYIIANKEKKWHFIKENMHGLPFYLKIWAENVSHIWKGLKQKVGWKCVKQEISLKRNLGQVIVEAQGLWRGSGLKHKVDGLVAWKEGPEGQSWIGSKAQPSSLDDLNRVQYPGQSHLAQTQHF